MKLMKAMKDQLMSLLLDAEESECYYGNREQYWKRHKKIKQWLLEQEVSK